MVTRKQLHAILCLPWQTLLELLDTLIVAVGMVCALHIEEICNIDVRYLLFYHDWEGTMVIWVCKRKNNQPLQGLWPSIGPALVLDIIGLLREWLNSAWLHVQGRCEKACHLLSSCRKCRALFSQMDTASWGHAPAQVRHHMHREGWKFTWRGDCNSLHGLSSAGVGGCS